VARDAQLKATITAKDDASKVIDKVADAADDLESKPVEVEVDADVAKVLGAFDQVAAEAKETAAAADVLGRALGPELAAKADTGAIVGELQQMGLTLDQITANADQLGGKMRELSEADVGGKLGASLGTTRGQMDELGKSAGSSKSVLANMIGNSVQDVGALGGVAGSAGVAIGQMGEYMADAAADGDSLKQILSGFGSVAGPLAAMAVAMQVVNQVMEQRAKSAKTAADAVESMSDAMDEGGSAAKNYADSLEEAGEIQGRFGKATADDMGGIASFVAKMPGAAGIALNLAGAFGFLGEKTDDLVDDFAKAGISVEQWTKAVSTGPAGLETMAAALAATNLSADEQAKIMESLTNAQGDWNTATTNGAAVAKVFGSDVEGATHATSFFTTALDRAKEVGAEAAKAQQEMADAVSEAGIAMLDAEANSEAFASALDRVNAASDLDFAQMAQDTVKSFDDVKGALDDIEHKSKIDWSNFDITPDEYSELKGMPDELAAVTDAVSGMRGSIQTELQAAFATGGIDAYTQKATFFRDQVVDQFPAKFKAMGASTEEAAAQTQALVADLGLLPEDVQIMIQLTREEEARNALDAFSTVIGQMPRDVQVAINTAIAEGDVESALAILNEQLINRGYPPIVLPVEANPAPAEATVAETTDTIDGTAATIEVGADPAPAEGTVDDTVSNIEGENPIIPVGSDPGDAASEVEGFVSETNAQTPEVKVAASVREALITMAIIGTIARAMAPEVMITANATSALRTAVAAANAIQSLSPQVGVNAYLRDYPSAGEIAARIGTVRVPVDAYIRTMPRITGLRADG
jgi:hypothetical protein